MPNEISNLQPIIGNSNIDLKAYGEWRDQVVHQIRQMRFRAAMQLNASNLAHYFNLGQEIIRKQQQMGWGKGVIKMLSANLTREFGADSGYSDRNLRNMKRFAQAYPNFPFWQAPLAEIHGNPIWQAALAKLPQGTTNAPELLSTEGQQIVQIPLAQISWYHHISLLSKVEDPLIRAYYILRTAQEGWSRDIMILQIANQAHLKQGMAITNFSETLPPADSDLARYMFKDPYNFGFVDMAQVKRETDLENQLVLRISEFLTEMGKGFAYVGHQVKLETPTDPEHPDTEDEEEEARIDLLMYHLRLHCYVAIELKVVPFRPEFTGKLNYYVSLVDEQFKTPEDRPTIGLLLCRTANSKKVEYALRGMTQPLGVSEYETQAIAQSVQSSIPTINQIESTISQSEEYNPE